MKKWTIFTVLNIFCFSFLRPSLGKEVLNQKKGPDGLPEIFWLIKQEDLPSIKKWLASGGDIESKGYHQATPVISAAIIDAWPIVLFLIESGANLTVVDKRGYSLAFLALRSRIKIDGPFGSALVKVREKLKENGLMDKVLNPTEMRKLINTKP